MTAPCRFDSPYHCYEHDGYTNKAAICHIGLAALRATVEAQKQADIDLTAAYARLRKIIEEQTRVIGRLQPIVQKLSTIHVISNLGQMVKAVQELADEALKALSPPEKEA